MPERESATLNLPFLSVPLSRAWRPVQVLFRGLSGLGGIERSLGSVGDRLSSIETHLSALTEITHILLADAMGAWDPEKRERVLREVANFTVVRDHVRAFRPTGNPFTEREIERLQEYLARAERGDPLTEQEARDFRELAERAAAEHPGQGWVADLLKIAAFAFAAYVLLRVLEPRKTA